MVKIDAGAFIALECPAAMDRAMKRKPSAEATGAWTRLMRARSRVLDAVEHELKKAGFPPLADTRQMPFCPWPKKMVSSAAQLAPNSGSASQSVTDAPPVMAALMAVPSLCVIDTVGMKIVLSVPDKDKGELPLTLLMMITASAPAS